MSTDEQLSAALGDLSFLDTLGVASRNGTPMLRFGCYVDLAIEHGDAVEKRKQMAKVIFDYVNIFKGEVTHYLPHDSNELENIETVNYQSYVEGLTHIDDSVTDHEGFYASVFGYHPDADIDDPTIYFAEAHGDTKLRRFSSLSIYHPASFIGRVGTTDYTQIIKRWCDLTSPSYGTAGPSVLFNEGRQGHEDRLAAFPLVKRFVGLDCPEPSRWYTSVGRDTSMQKSVRAIRTINWLTIIDDGFVRDLGGVEKIQVGIGEECKIHQYEGGIIIQAGARPELGDANRGLIPENYRKVARTLKPIRFENYDTPLLDAPKPLDSLDETRKWAARFE